MKVKKGTYERKQRQDKPFWLANAFKIGLPVLGLLAAIAIIWDIHYIGSEITSGSAAKKESVAVSNRIRRIEFGLDGKRYTNSDGKFSIVPPAGWEIDTDGNEGYFDVTFRGRQGLELNILATKVNYGDFSKLKEEIEDKEENIGLKTHIEEGEFKDHSAVYRRVELKKSRLYSVDFLAKGMAHHLLFKAPRGVFEKYLPVMKDVMNTYRPESPPEKQIDIDAILNETQEDESDE